MQSQSRFIIHAAFAACLAFCAAELPTNASAGGADPLVWIDGAEGLAYGERFHLANVEAPSVGVEAACDRERGLGEIAKEFMTKVTSGDNAGLKLTTVGRIPQSEQLLATVIAQGEDIAEIGLRSGHLARWEHGYTKPIEPPPVWCLDGENHRKHEVISRARWANTIGEREVSFVAFDMESGTGYELEGSSPHERRAPWSTFKIPNLLLALETKTAMGLDHPIDWDRTRRFANGRLEPVGNPVVPACDLFGQESSNAKEALALFANALNAEWDKTGALVLWSGNDALILSRSPTMTSAPPEPK